MEGECRELRTSRLEKSSVPWNISGEDWIFYTNFITNVFAITVADLFSIDCLKW